MRPRSPLGEAQDAITGLPQSHTHNIALQDGSNDVTRSQAMKLAFDARQDTLFLHTTVTDLSTEGQEACKSAPADLM